MIDFVQNFVLIRGALARAFTTEPFRWARIRRWWPEIRVPPVREEQKRSQRAMAEAPLSVVHYGSFLSRAVLERYVLVPERYFYK